MKRKYVKVALIFTVSLHTGVFLIGCSSKIPQPKAWVSVEKPPVRVIYIDYEKDITADTVHKLTDQVSRVRYEDYKFNDNAIVGISYDVKAIAEHKTEKIVNINR